MTYRTVQDLLPRIFTRAIPIVDARASTLEAGSLLHTHQIDALGVVGEKVSRRNFLAIGGSCATIPRFCQNQVWVRVRQHEEWNTGARRSKGHRRTV